MIFFAHKNRMEQLLFENNFLRIFYIGTFLWNFELDNILSKYLIQKYNVNSVN